MAGKEISISEEKAPLKAIPVELKGEEGAQKGPEKAGEKLVKTDIEIKKEAVQKEKENLKKKQQNAKEVAEGKQVYDEGLSELDGPGVVPTRPDEKMVKKEDFEQSQKELQEQENKTANSLESKMNSELESVTKTGKIDQLDVPTQTKIRTEIIQASIDPQRLPDEKKKEILSTMKGADGKLLLDISKVDLKHLTPYQKDFILNSDAVKSIASSAVEQYKNIQDEVKKSGKNLDPELVKKLQLQVGLSNTDALDLSQIRPGIKLTEHPAGTHIGIIQRVLSESTFSELRDILSDGMRWEHVPDRVKLEIATNSFNAESEKNTPEIRQAILDARSVLVSAAYENNTGENDSQRAARIKEKIGVSAAASANLKSLSLEANKSGLSPGMRALADFFGPIGAALGMPFWQKYMGENGGRDETEDTSDRYMAGDGNNEYKGEVGTQSLELAKNGFKGDVMNSIWRWEYQAGHNVQVVPAGKSGLTLCGGIDLAYTPYSQVQNIFQGILKPETITKLQPFCDNGRQGPIRGAAESLLRTKTGLKEEINGQLNYQNMGEAFTRSLALDWQRLVNKHGSKVKDAPGYIQVFMLSRFYHAGIGGSADIIRKIIASGYNHSSVVSIAENFRDTRGEGYYRNRMNKEISYLKASPGDAKPVNKDIVQNSTDSELSRDKTAVQWFEKNAGKQYGSGEGKFDCMTSTHAALGLDYTKKYASDFNKKFIDTKNDSNNLWNVSMVSALYAGNISSANSETRNGVILKKQNGYYGDKSDDIGNMEYYIEENVMKRVSDSSDGMVDVGNNGKLIHYSKSRKGVSGIITDIKTRLRPGESAMMGATGDGTNNGGHEWLVYNDNGILKAYDATGFGGQGVSGTGTELSSFLDNSRRSKYSQEAIIFAKKSEPSSSRGSNIT